MKKITQITSVLTMLIWFFSTNAFSQVEFTPDISNGCAPLTVNFTNLSVTNGMDTTGVIFIWDYEDGTPNDTGYNASHTFTSGSTEYDVQLLADSSGFNMGEYGQNIQVNGSRGYFQTSTGSQACVGESSTYYYDENYSSLEWRFADGQIQNWNWVGHTYNTPGTYYDTMIVVTSCGTDTVVQAIDISNSAIPVAQINYNQNPVCYNDSVYFSNQFNPPSYFSQWYFGDGDSAMINEPAHAYTDTGTYQVILITTNTCLNSNSDTVEVDVDTGLTVSASNMNFWPNPSCPLSPVYFSAGSSGNYIWDFGNGDSSSLRAPQIQYSDTGIYNVQLIVTNGCGNSDTSWQNITVQYDSSNTPNADFWFDYQGPTPPGDTMNICPGETMGFRNNTNENGNTTYLWLFGDGDSATTNDATHDFLTEGAFTVLLIASNSCMGVDTAIKWVIVDSLTRHTSGYFETSTGPAACVNEGVSYWYNGGNYDNLEWRFGDGEVSNWGWPMHTYFSPGTYYDTLIVSEFCGMDTIVQAITISNSAIPAPQIQSNQNTVCPNDPVFFSTNSNGSSYLWDFGDSITSTASNPSHSYADTGNYDVILTLTNICGNSNSDTVQVSVESYMSAWIGNFNIWPNPSCPLSDVNFYSYTSGSYIWDFGNGDFSYVNNPQTTYSDTGLYNIQLIVTNGCGFSDTAWQDLTIQFDPGNAPNANFWIENFYLSNDTLEICPGQMVELRNDTWGNGNNTYLWLFGDGDSATSYDASHTYFNEGSFTVQLIATNSCMASDTATKWVIVDSLNTSSSGYFETSTGPSACVNEEVTYWYNGGNYDYLEWRFGDGDIASWNWVGHEYSSNGTYYDTLLVTTFCGTDTIVQAITIGDSIIPDAEIEYNQDQVCPNDLVYFNANSSAVIYSWDFGDGDSSGVPGTSHAYNDTGTYQVILTTTNLCGNSNSDTVMIFVDTNIQVNANNISVWDDYSCPNDLVQCEGYTSGSYYWDFGNGFTSTQMQTATYYSDTGNYYIQVIITNACGFSDSAYRNVTIQYDTNRTPEANIRFDNEDYMLDTITVCPGEEVSLENDSWDSPLTFLWLFGDGDTSTLKDVTHIYTAAGTYEIQMIATNTCLGKDTAFKWVVVDPLASPNSQPSAIPFALCPGDPVFFMDDQGDPDENNYTYSIWFGDGDSAVNITEPIDSTIPFLAIHTYQDTGTYQYLFTTTNLCGITDSVIDTILVGDPNPAPMLMIGNSTEWEGGVCPGENILFYAIGGDSLLWDFGDSTTGYGMPAIHSYPDVGIYYPYVVIISGCGEIDTIPDTVNVTLNNTPYAYFDMDKSFTCAYNPVNFEASGDGGGSFDMSNNTYYWDFGDSTNSTLRDPSHVYTSAGVFTVSLTVTNGCGSETWEDYIIIDMPTVSFTGLSSGYCIDDDPDTLSGSPAGGIFSGNGIGGNVFDPSLAGSGMQTITYSYTNQNGCCDSMSLNIIVNPLPPADAGGDLFICSGGNVQLNATGGISYSWTPADSLDDPNIANPVANPTDTTIYTVTVTSVGGCIAEDSVTVQVAPSLTANAGTDEIICTGDSIMLVATGGGNYSWTPSATLSNPGIANPYASPVVTTTYTITVFSASCSDSDSVVVNVNPLPVVSITPGGSTTFCFGDSVTLSSSTGVSYLWNTGDTIQSTVITSSGNNFVTVTDSNGCSATNSLTTTERPALSLGIYGNAVSCNGLCDGDATVTVPGGIPPYTYLWDLSAGGQTTATATGLCAGTYSVTVTDSASCADSSSIVIPEPGVISASTLVSGASCNGSCDGYSIAMITGGVVPYSFIWDDPSSQNTAVATGLCAGTVNIIVTDANGCTDTADAVITEPAVLSLSATGNNPTCNGSCNGSVTAASNGGTTPYYYQWNDPSSQTTATAAGLCAGTYSVVVMDANGCTDTASTVISEPTVLSSSVTGSNTSCNGICDGSATLTSSGGTAPYSYLWDDPGSQTTATATGLCAGTFSVIIIDNNGCTDTLSIIITEPTALSVSASENDATCNSGCDGDATVSVSGGTVPYAFQWDDPLSQTGMSANVLCAGAYIITVNDSNGCVITDSITIGEPTAITLTFGTSDASCGNPDGEAYVSATGSTPPYDYLWDDPGSQTTDTASAISAGVYNITVTDSSGCAVTGSVSVNDAGAGTVSIVTSTDVSCNGGSDGQATATASGGVPPYTYLWNDPGSQATATATGLTAGAYIVTVADSNGCVGSASDTIIEPAAISLSDVISNASCNGICDGSATLTASGGTPPYFYLWDDPASQSTVSATGLCTGTYNVIVTDSMNCPDTLSVIISEPTILSLFTATNDASCYGICDGSALVAPSGGTTPYNYLWDDLSSQTTAISTGLCAGSYSVIVTDANGCVDTSGVVISEPASLTASSSGNDALCNGVCDGSASATASGGTSPYGYLWDDPASQTTVTATSLCAGTYNVIVTDSAGCTDTSGITISEPVAQVTSVSGNDALCSGSCDGSATVTTTGGTAPYNYQWDDPGTQITITATGLCAGTYSVVVTDSNSCTDTTSVLISEPALLTTSGSGNNMSCNGICDGSVTVTPSGGTSPYVYLWDDPSSQTGATAFGLCPGTYTVTVADSSGCMTTNSLSITEPAAITLVLNAVDATCGNPDGDASVVASNGVGTYTYLWDDPGTQSTDTATGLSAGTYNVTVTDSMGCFAVGTVSVNDAGAATVTISSSTGVSCNGGSDGQATVSATGGTPPYAYLWDDAGSQTTASATGLIAGIYNVSVTDSAGCVATVSVTIGEPSALTTSLSGNDASCNGDCDGDATVTAAGGTMPYAYLWNDSGAQTTSIATGLCAGTYSATLTDSNGCTATDSVVISEPAVLVLSLSSVDASCGNPDGSATVVTSGGIPPYNYLWDDPASQTADTVAGLAVGTYNVVVSDANSCTGTGNIAVNNAGAPTVSILSSVDVNCNGGADGSITLSVTGGTPPYYYLWDDPLSQTTLAATGLSAGIFNATITDSTGCIAIILDTINEPSAPVSLIANSVNSSCGQSDGEVSVIAAGGTTPYTYLWDDPGSSTTDTVTGLAAGTYNITVTDANDCQDTASVVITEPHMLSIAATGTDVNCNGVCDGDAFAVLSGGSTPYYYLWNDPASQTTSTATGLCAGVYDVVGADSIGCPATTTVAIGEPPALTVTTTVNNISCYGACDGNATVTVTGGTSPYSYLWDDPGTQATSSATGLCAGTFNVTVTDANGCTETSSATISEPPALNITSTVDTATYGVADGIIYLNVSGGTASYNYTWSNGAPDSSVATGLAAGTYGVTVMDANGCLDSASIDVPEATGIENPQGFQNPEGLGIYPNPTEGLITFDIKLKETTDVEIQIQNVVGEILHSYSLGEIQKVMHEVDMSELPNGVYFVKLVTKDSSINKRIVITK
ncbi:MAG: PKD domain-containing protein [Bacteroidota bacterium]